MVTFMRWKVIENGQPYLSAARDKMMQLREILGFSNDETKASFDEWVKETTAAYPSDRDWSIRNCNLSESKSNTYDTIVDSAKEAKQEAANERKKQKLDEAGPTKACKPSKNKQKKKSKKSTSEVEEKVEVIDPIWETLQETWDAFQSSCASTSGIKILTLDMDLDLDDSEGKESGVLYYTSDYPTTKQDKEEMRRVLFETRIIPPILGPDGILHQPNLDKKLVNHMKRAVKMGKYLGIVGSDDAKNAGKGAKPKRRATI